MQKNPPDLAIKLKSIYTTYAYTDDEGNSVLSHDIAELIQTLENFYRQPQEKIENQRGAIVELLGRRLVCSRYRDDTNDPSPMIQRKLKQLRADPCIGSYGIDRLMTLRDTPFD